MANEVFVCNESVHNSAKHHLCLMYFVLFSRVQFSRRYGNVASIRQIRERHKEEDPKNKTPILKNQPVSVLLWRELHWHRKCIFRQLC